MLPRLAIPLVAAICWTSSACAETPAALTERFLVEGKLAEGEKALTEIVAAHPDDAEARFGLGTIQFVRATERLVQSFHRYGMRTSLFGNALAVRTAADPGEPLTRSDPLQRPPGHHEDLQR